MSVSLAAVTSVSLSLLDDITPDVELFVEETGGLCPGVVLPLLDKLLDVSVVEQGEPTLLVVFVRESSCFWKKS